VQHSFLRWTFVKSKTLLIGKRWAAFQITSIPFKANVKLNLYSYIQDKSKNDTWNDLGICNEDVRSSGNFWMCYSNLNSDSNSCSSPSSITSILVPKTQNLHFLKRKCHYALPVPSQWKTCRGKSYKHSIQPKPDVDKRESTSRETTSSYAFASTHPLIVFLSFFLPQWRKI